MSASYFPLENSTVSRKLPRNKEFAVAIFYPREVVHFHFLVRSICVVIDCALEEEILFACFLYFFTQSILFSTIVIIQGRGVEFQYLGAPNICLDWLSWRIDRCCIQCGE